MVSLPAVADNVKGTCFVTNDEVVVLLEDPRDKQFNSGHLKIADVRVNYLFNACIRRGEENVLRGEFLSVSVDTQTLLDEVRQDSHCSQAWISRETVLEVTVSGKQNETVSITLPEHEYRLVWQEDGQTHRTAWTTDMFQLGCLRMALHLNDSYLTIRKVQLPPAIRVIWIDEPIGQSWRSTLDQIKRSDRMNDSHDRADTLGPSDFYIRR